MAPDAVVPPAGAPPAGLLRGLTELQRGAVASDAAPLCVLAGAGSGKTTVLTRRVARRVLDGSAAAEHVLVVTFTRKAAGELRSRLARLGVPGTVRAGTFHAVALAQLRRHWADRAVRPPGVLDDPTRLVRGALEGLSTAGPSVADAVAGEVHWAQVRMLAPDDYPPAAEAAGRLPPAALSFEQVAAAYARYLEEKRRRAVMDLDDVVTTAAAVLEHDPSAAAAVRWRTRHLFVDEFQDVNPAQWRLLRAWLGDGRDLFVVGDARQAIYSWNGADPSLLDRLPQLLPGTAVLRLDDNHRCTPQVVTVATAVLGDRPCPASRPDGPWPVVGAFDDEDAEGRGLARWLRRTRPPGGRWSQYAVLARTHARLEPVAVALAAAGIPCRVAGPSAPAARWRALTAALRRQPPRRFVRSALADVLVERATGDEGVDDVLRRLVDEHLVACPEGSVGDFLDWLVAEVDVDAELEQPDGVELSTFHRAKGLEWSAVAVVGLEDGLVPIAYATTPEALAEERRLVYVALTRARDELWCSWARTRRTKDRTWTCRPSPVVEAVEEASRGGRPVRDAGLLLDRVASLRQRLPHAG